MLIHAFIKSRLDLIFSLASHLKHLQYVQNSAARLLAHIKLPAHITPVLYNLYWLLVDYRIQYKLLLYTFKILHGLAPTYLQDSLHNYTSSRSLRSTDSGLVLIPKYGLSSMGGKAFSIEAPKVWNALPKNLRKISITQFKTHLNVIGLCLSSSIVMQCLFLFLLCKTSLCL